MLLQSFAQSFHSPLIRILLGVIAIALLYVLWREVRKIPAKLLTLMATASSTWSGVLMIFPLLPFYVKQFGGSGFTFLGLHFGIGIIAGFIIASFTVAQLVSAPVWGQVFRSSRTQTDAAHRVEPPSAIAYLIFGFADSLLMLFLSRIVQGAGGGTVGVIQAYVADSTKPAGSCPRAGVAFCTTNLGVALGPVLGSFANHIG
jgi:MFS family permease